MIDKYDSFVFDCDGVILDSNKLKTEIFEFVLSDFEQKKIDLLISYHLENGGVTRQKKFEYFISHLMNEQSPCVIKEFVAARSKRYGELCQSALLDCPMVAGVEDFIHHLSSQNKKLAVVTGGAEDEVKKIFKHKDIIHCFDYVLGNPKSKQDNMSYLRTQDYFIGTPIYFGDAKLDWLLANEFNCDFVFVKDYSEWRPAQNLKLTTISNFLKMQCV